MKITNEIIDSYYDCPYKAYLKLQGLRGQKCNLEKLLYEELHERKRQFCKKKINRTFPKRVNLITNSTPLVNNDWIVNAEIRHENFELNCELLKKTEVKSAAGKFHYTPTIILNSEKVSKKHKIIVAALAYVLNKVLGSPIEYGIAVFSSDLKSTKVRVRQHIREFHSFASRIEQNEEPPFRLNSHCTMCEFCSKCKEKAIKEDHLSLLRGMTSDRIKKLNRKGIFNVNQLSYTFRPKRKSIKNYYRLVTRSFELQALAIREKKIFIYDMPDPLPQTKTEMFLDIEGLPDSNFFYLIGLIIKTTEKVVYHFFWSNEECDVIENVQELLALLAGHNDYTVYHYGSYETDFLEFLKKRIPQRKDEIDTILKRMQNILSLLYSHIYFPTYSNGLKEIGQFIGAKWSEEAASGIESIFWRKSWQLSRDRDLRQKLITYNKEDCDALLRLKNVVSAIVENRTDAGLEVCDVKDLHRKQRAVFANDSLFPEIRFLNACAYFDYQQEKVSSKTSRALKEGERKRSISGKYFATLKPNTIISLVSKCCILCKSRKIAIKSNLKRKVLDLKFTRSGVRRFITQFYSHKFFCHKCKSTFIPDGFPPFRLYVGHNLIAWVIFQHIANKQSFRTIGSNFNELFNLRLSKSTSYAFKGYFMMYYKRTFDELMEKVLNSKVLHIDETPFALRFSKGYVWVLTNGREVVSLYRPTREADFIRGLLKNFKGILVTDFYAGYDSIDCTQQRCLLHLIRDFNSDLVKNPYNEEFKELAKRFTTLLQNIVHTINRFGLKKYYLNRYKKDAQRFLAEVKTPIYKTEIARQYQTRFKRNENRLFQFLSHDNVSWNNNTAEHAIRILAMRTNKDTNTFKETRIEDYLKIMSIYQTCKVRNISFFKFLLSKEISIDKFVDRNPRRSQMAPV